MATVYTGMNLFDGNDVENKAGSWMLVGDDGRIESVGTGTAPAADATVDLTGKYVMPGLINCHTHTMLDAYDPKLTMFSETEIAFRGIKHLKALIDCGVTTIRECASAFSVDCKLAALQRKGELADMPTIVPSGRSMSMTGGHGDMQMGLEGESNGSHLVDSPDEMRKAVREEFKLGAKNIKMMATGGVMSPTDQIDDTELTVEEMKVAVEEA
ncbi:amidohydrolase family protein, partial [Bifidobacterium scardovii]